MNITRTWSTEAGSWQAHPPRYGEQEPVQTSLLNLSSDQPKGKHKLRNHWFTAGPFQICPGIHGRVSALPWRTASQSLESPRRRPKSLPAVVPGGTQRGELLSLFPLLNPRLPEGPEPVQQLKQTEKKWKFIKAKDKMISLTLLANLGPKILLPSPKEELCHNL